MKENITQEMHIPSKDVKKYMYSQNIISKESEGKLEQVITNISYFLRILKLYRDDLGYK